MALDKEDLGRKVDLGNGGKEGLGVGCRVQRDMPPHISEDDKVTEHFFLVSRFQTSIREQATQLSERLKVAFSKKNINEGRGWGDLIGLYSFLAS